jgi:hypothetical protein
VAVSDAAPPVNVRGPETVKFTEVFGSGVVGVPGGNEPLELRVPAGRMVNVKTTC